ncbi:kazrin-like isoform X2 [Anneissia japonica]|uniref:kazrin-like isoform X2 n=1 Tax=Anneissia japonica TaxID=1529436 RepID=UPI001425B608|nr:kazrin-like isoform X2 [Anneissia japonica]
MISVRRVWLTEDWMNSEYGFNYMELAIQSLDTLNDQIVQFIFSPKLSENDTSISHPPERDSLKSNLALMRRLLVDAQSKFRKVMDENKRLTARIDHSQQSANQEVNALKSELAERDRRLTEIGEHGNIQDNKEWQRQQEENEHQKELQKLRDRNSKLEAENKNLLRQLDDLRVINSYQTEIPQASELQIQLTRTEHDLARAKEALTAMKADRKRLKVEKVDLLKQMKQLYRTLEANEGSVRSYIHKFEEQIMEKDSELQRMQEEKEEMDKDKWELLQRAKEAAERAMGLRNSNEEKDRKIATLKHVLDQLRRELSEVTHRPVETTFPIHITTSTPYDTPCDTPLSTPSGKGSQDGDTDNDTTSLIPSENSSPPMSRSQRSQTQSMIAAVKGQMEKMSKSFSYSQEDDESRILLISSDHISVSSEELSTNRTVFDNHKKKKKSGKFSSLSKVFGKKNKSTLEHLSFDDSVISINSLSVSSKHSSMVEIGLDEQEKLRLAELCKVQPMHQWRANTVLAWLELAMCLPQYTLKCAENVKSGKVLLGLSDAELEVGLGITNPLHKRKVRLAVEESRNPTQASYPKIGDLDHRWVCRTWLNDIGLPQYSATFEQEKIDGRVLNTLTKKDLEKHLNITVRFHQVSILYGIEVLRKVQFDKKILTERRNSCEGLDADPLVWTNQRFIKWTKSIDLKEYANNLIETGVHGGVVVIDTSFTPEHLGTCLGISTTKNILRRHLTSEINSLIRPARSLLDSESGTMPNLNTKSSKHVQASLQRSHFVRSYMGNEDELRGSRRRPMFRGSIGRAFGRKFRQSAMESQNRGNFTDTRPKSRSHELLNHSAPS